MNILVAVDDSKFTADILKAVAQQFRPENTQARVVHVLQPITTAPPPQMDANYAPELADEKLRGRELLESCASELRKAGFSVTVDLEVGDVREKIIDLGRGLAG